MVNRYPRNVISRRDRARARFAPLFHGGGDGGLLMLALPDKRFTFDAPRNRNAGMNALTRRPDRTRARADAHVIVTSTPCG